MRERPRADPRSSRSSTSTSPSIPAVRCAVYTRKSSDEGLEQAFNSLHAQREACEAFVTSQRHEGWTCLPTLYDDGGFSGGSMDRPALRRLIADISAGLVDCVVVYKVDRLTRSLADFAKMVEVFDDKRVSFVSVTQAFNTTSSMGRLTLNVLLSFAQFEREVTGERIRDKIAASKKKGLWMGGWVPLGYRASGRTLAIEAGEADTVRTIFALYLELGNVRLVEGELRRRAVVTKTHVSASGKRTGRAFFSRGHIYKLLSNPLYVGRISHKGETHAGQHPAIIERGTWDAVQALLKSNGHARRVGQNAKAASLLAGLLVDEAGETLRPVHANKDGRRYRYYVGRSAAAGQDRRGEGDRRQDRERAGDGATCGLGDNRPPPLRLPAAEIEPLVLEQVAALLRDEQRVLGWITGDEHGTGSAGVAEGRGERASRAGSVRLDEVRRVLEHAGRLAAALETGTTAERREVLTEIVRQIQIAESVLWITLNRPALLGWMRDAKARKEGDGDDGTIDVHDQGISVMANGYPRVIGMTQSERDEVIVRVSVVPMRRGAETRLVLPDASQLAFTRAPDRSLLKAMVRAHSWWEDLASGRAASIQALAEREGITDRYVSHLLDLAFLSPRIVEAVMNGSYEAPLSTKALTLEKTVPLSWREQERMMGATSAG